ncbi:MAG: sugar ABC transporter permease [Anaerolineae bacterium]|nr:sugar ABC transporter permease [Anaerolineae bacterium]NUQ05412.1 sugar ABC transporter permease [Anaerolineae bacterium]
MASRSTPRFRFTQRERPAANERPRTRTEQLLTIGLFVLPGAAIYTLFLVFPIVQASYFSLHDWNGLGPVTDFIGLGNFERAFQHDVFVNSVIHSLTIMSLSLAIQLPLAIMLALMVGRKLPGRMIYRSIFFMPYVFSEVVTAIIWLFVYNPGGGMLNTVLSSIFPGYVPQGWLANRDIALLAVFFVITWKYFGLHMILYMAGLQSINSEVEESARIDGANELQVLRYITLPLLAPTIRLSVYLSVLGSLNQFVLVWVLTTGGPANATQVMASYMYRFGVKSFNLGYGSAVAVIIFVISLIFSIGYQRTIMRRDYAGSV